MDAGLIAALAAAGAATAGAGGTWLGTRRRASGRISTSDAGTLWKAAEKMRAETEARAEKAEAQRDRLIEAQADSVGPALASITSALALIAAALARNSAALDRLEAKQQ